MEITRDVFLTDAREPHFTLGVASRDLTGHRLLTALSDDERRRLGDLLAEHGAALQRLLRDAWATHEPDRATSSFGCGT